MEEIKNGDYPMNFGAACAFVALHLMSRTTIPELEHGEVILLGSAQLLGLLIERAQRRGDALEEKLKRAEFEVREMKLIRAEDAKANEKVVSIFASHEQRWIAERKRLGHQIQSLAAELQSLTAKNEEAVSNLNKRVMEAECAVRFKDEVFKEERQKREELEEKLKLAEEVTQELREKAKKEAQDHSYELRKHRTAIAELVSNQRQLEAERGRTFQQAQAAKQELEEMIERKEEAVLMAEKLSDEIVKMRKDAEQKDKILSAMLRKSKLDVAEKQMLLKEVKISKAKKKQADLETERWRNMWESRNKKGPRASYSVEAGCSQGRRAELQLKSSGFNIKTLLFDYLDAESQKEYEFPEPKGEKVIAAINCLDQYSSEGRDELVPDDIQHLQDWVRLEIDKYAAILEQRHFKEIEAFTEQMRLKDEKLEAFHWRLLSMDIESKRLQSHIEGLDENISQLREENLKLEALLLDREEEIKSLKEQFGFFVHYCQKNNSNHSTSWACDPQVLWSEMRLGKRKPREKEQEVQANSTRNSHKAESKTPEGGNQITNGGTIHHYTESKVKDIAITSSIDSAPPTNHSEDLSIICINELSLEEAESVENASDDQAKSITLVTQSPEEEIEEEDVNIDTFHTPIQNYSHKETDAATKLALVGQSSIRKDSSWKTDIHALGVSYKIKRLKQQLLMLEKLAVMNQISSEDNAINISNQINADDKRQQLKGFVFVINLLNKQVKRFQSLEDQTDDLCRRLHENSRGGSRTVSHDGKTKEQNRKLEDFLEETFQLQRYMVATGQKLMDIHSKITCSFGSGGLDESSGINMGLFADVIRTLFREIQRGLEVRIARIIGDLEGTLACDGILHMRD